MSNKEKWKGGPEQRERRGDIKRRNTERRKERGGEWEEKKRCKEEEEKERSKCYNRRWEEGMKKE